MIKFKTDCWASVGDGYQLDESDANGITIEDLGFVADHPGLMGGEGHCEHVVTVGNEQEYGVIKFNPVSAQNLDTYDPIVIYYIVAYEKYWNDDVQDHMRTFYEQE